MLRTSEWVSLGHADKIADYISCYILDRYLEKDPFVRFALEVQIKNSHVSLGGEITSKHVFEPETISAFVREAVSEIGYTKQYQRKWGKDNAICADELEVSQYIGLQSADIAQGVNNNGWGDQGIFHGMAVNTPETDYMPKDWFIAKQIGQRLYDNRTCGGLDIKTQVTMMDDAIEEIVIAIPQMQRHSQQDIKNVVSNILGKNGYRNLHINGTGRYVTHGPVGDCGTTGRKLAVDFYGGNCKIGGGNPWGKDATKADLTLNMLARFCALEYSEALCSDSKETELASYTILTILPPVRTEKPKQRPPSSSTEPKSSAPTPTQSALATKNSQRMMNAPYSTPIFITPTTDRKTKDGAFAVSTA